MCEEKKGFDHTVVVRCSGGKLEVVYEFVQYGFCDRKEEWHGVVSVEVTDALVCFCDKSSCCGVGDIFES
jgi:hypothetical protein